MTSPWLLIAGDIATLVAFGFIGVASHEEAISAEIVARSIVPFVVTWLVIGGISGMFGSAAQVGRVDPARFLAAWLIAGTLAMIARALIFDRELITAFFVIGIVGYGIFLAGWRLAYHRIVGGRHAPAREGA